MKWISIMPPMAIPLRISAISMRILGSVDGEYMKCVSTG